MKRTLLAILVIIFFIITAVIMIEYNNNNVLESEHRIVKSNTISLMYETSADSGVYEEQNTTNWPGSGYEFNETLSGCENGSTVDWNSTTNKVVIMGNISDKCYVYFDIEVELSAVNLSYSNLELTECAETKCALNELYSIFGG